MDNSGLISVIIPCYNAESFVEQAVLSIMNQTYRNVEIICLDDASTDKTLSILESLALDDGRVSVYKNERNLGLIETLNKGISLCKGEFIARMDADDISLPRRFERQLSFLRKTGADVCGCYYKEMTHNGRFFMWNQRFVHHKQAMKFVGMFESPLAHPAVIAKAEVFKDNPYELTESSYVNEDYHLWCRLMNLNKTFVQVPEFLFIYRNNRMGESSSKTDIQRQNQCHCALMQQQRTVGINLLAEQQFLYLLNTIQYVDSKLLHDCLMRIEKIKLLFVERFEVSDQERVEIEEWVIQRSIRVNFFALVKGNGSLRLFALKFLLSRPAWFIRKRTWLNLFYKSVWLVSGFREKVIG